MADWPHPSSNWAQISGKPLHHISFIYSRMHIYPWQVDPIPLNPIEHRSVENHYTKYLSYIAQCIYTHWRLTPPLPQSIEYRCLEYCYTKLGRFNGRCTPQLSIDALNTATPNLSDLFRSASRSPPYQSNIDALTTTTPNLADLL